MQTLIKIDELKPIFTALESCEISYGKAIEKITVIVIDRIENNIIDDDELDDAATVFCSDYYPDYPDITKETEVFDAGANWMRDKLIKELNK